MTALRASEALVARVIAAHAGGPVDVRQRDHNSGSAVHDLDLFCQGRLFGAVEVTEDLDEGDAQWERLREPLLEVPGCSRGWDVILASAPKFPDRWATGELAPFLRELESQRVEHRVSPETPGTPTPPASLTDLGYAAAVHDDAIPAGHARLRREQWDQLTVDNVDDLADWVEEFSSSDRCAGERSKLAASGLPERHLAIVVPFSPASGRRLANLLSSGVQLWGPPRRVPKLPAEITHVWLISSYPGVSSLVVALEGWGVTKPATPLNDGSNQAQAEAGS